MMMTIFNKNKAPKGWLYPFNRKELMSLINETGAKFENIYFGNTRRASKYLRDTKSCWFGVLTSKRVDDEYYFLLELNSMEEEVVKPWKKEIVKYVGNEMKTWIEWKTKQPVNSSEKPTRYFLRYTLKNNQFSSSCFEAN